VNTFRQLLSGLFAGAILLILVAGSLFLSAGDAVSSTTLGVATTLPLPPSLTPAPPSNTPTLIPTTTCSRPEGWIDYIVVDGDDLNTIAARFGLDPLALQTANCLSDANITVGQNLFVPPPTPTPTATITPTMPPGQTPVTPMPTLCGPPFGWKIYIVGFGDTLFSIARATGTTVQRLMLANCLDNTNIRVGQRLFVPRLPIVVTATFTPTHTPTVPTPTVSATPSPSWTIAPITDTPTATFSAPTTEIPTPTDTPSPSDTDTPAPTTPIQTPTPSPTIDLPPSDTPTDQPTPSPSATV
jgi:LysM repeat protein